MVLVGNVLAVDPTRIERMSLDQQLQGAQGAWGSSLGADRPWQVKHHWQSFEVSWRCQRRAVMVCGAVEQEACPLPGWEDHEGAEEGKPSLCPSPHPCGFSRMLNTSLVECLPSTQGSPGEELLKSNLTQHRMGSGGAGEGLNATTKTAATHRGNSSSPSALPWLSVGQVLLKYIMSPGELLVASPFCGFAHSLFQLKP